LGIRPVKSGCWFDGGDDLTGALQDLQLQLWPRLPSSLAPVKLANPGLPGKMADKMVREGWLG